MKSSVAAVLVAATGALAGSNVTYTTEIVTAITTYCPEATTLTHAGTTYTISEVSSRATGDLSDPAVTRGFSTPGGRLGRPVMSPCALQSPLPAAARLSWSTPTKAAYSKYLT